MKKAIVLTSFGTSHRDTREKTIDALFNDIKDMYPDYDVRQVYTSKIIREKIRQDEDIEINNLGDELDLLVEEGYQEIIVQSSHIIPGAEFHKIYMYAKRIKDKNVKLKVGKPLLTSYEDYQSVVKYLTETFTFDNQEEITLFMSHGTDHASFTSYVTLAYMLQNASIYMACVESYPEITDIMEQLKENKVKKIHLRPFMLVAGDHAKNDMASDDEDSWKSQLIKEGFEVETHVKGLGELKPIREMYLKHLQEAIQYESRCRHAR